MNEPVKLDHKQFEVLVELLQEISSKLDGHKQPLDNFEATFNRLWGERELEKAKERDGEHI